MEHLYSSITVLINDQKQVDYKKTALLIERELAKGVKNYFVDQYYYNEYDFIDSDFFDFYKKMAGLLPQNSKLIIDMSSDMLCRVDSLITELAKEKIKQFYSLNLTTEFLEEYRNQSSQLLKILEKNSDKIYFKIIPQGLEHQGFQKILAANQIKGLIIETAYDPDWDVKSSEKVKASQSDLEIIYKADDLYLVALKNNNSIVSNYAGMLTEDFLTIYKNYSNKKYEEALQSQEFLNKKLNLLEKYNYFKVINYYLKHIEKLSGSSFNNRKLNSVEKRELKNILSAC